MTKRRDPMDRAIESALQAGHFIGWNQGTAFVSGLENLEGEIAALSANSPARAAALYEAFIAACNLKAEEIDDSDGEFGSFAGSLFCGWIQARQAASADPGATAETLLAWMKNDDYGFCNELVGMMHSCFEVNHLGRKNDTGSSPSCTRECKAKQCVSC